MVCACAELAVNAYALLFAVPLSDAGVEVVTDRGVRGLAAVDGPVRR